MDYDIEVRLATQTDGDYIGLFDKFSIRLVRGGYEALLAPAAMKPYVTNESRLKDGTQYAAMAQFVKKTERNISLSFSLEASSVDEYLARYEAFLDFLASGLIFFKVPRLKRVFKFVYIDCDRFVFHSLKWSTFTIEFREPDPTDRIPL